MEEEEPKTEHKRWLEPELPPANGQDRYNFRAAFGFLGIKKSENSNNAESLIHGHQYTEIHGTGEPRDRDKVTFLAVQGRQRRWNENKIIAFLLSLLLLPFFVFVAASKPVSPQLGNKFD